MATERPALLIWGAGQHGRVVAEYARAAGFPVLGFADANPALRDCVVDAAGARVLLLEHELRACLKGARQLPPGIERIVPAIGDNATRFQQMLAIGARLAPPIVHPAAVISPSASIANGSVVAPLSLVNTNAHVGRGVIVNSGSIVGHDSELADAVHVGGGAVLNGGTRIGARTFIGAAATLIPGLRVGADTIIGAGAVVLHDVPDGVTAVGVPARTLKGANHGIREATYLPLAAPSFGA